MRAEAIILMYHDLSPRRGDASVEDIPYVLEPEAFRRNLQAVRSAGLPVANVGAWVSGRGGSDASGKRRDRPALLLTFDDGDASNHEHALPLLLESQFTATFFVIPLAFIPVMVYFGLLYTNAWYLIFLGIWGAIVFKNTKEWAEARDVTMENNPLWVHMYLLLMTLGIGFAATYVLL